MKKLSTREFVIMAFLVALSVLLDISPLGTLRLPTVNATIAHIPTIIGSILLGPVVGAVVGLSFGLSSLIRNLTQPTSILAFTFINPLVSVLPRVLVGITSYYVYILIKKISSDSIGTIIGAMIGSITNTVGVLGMMYVLYAAQIVEKIDPSTTVKGMLLGIVAAHGVPEMIISAILTVAIIKGLRRVYKFK